jgi:hypothetical protein
MLISVQPWSSPQSVARDDAGRATRLCVGIASTASRKNRVLIGDRP